MPPASRPLPNTATGFYKFAFIDFVGLCPIFFQKRYSSSPDQSCLTDQSLCINGSDLRSDYFISLTQLTNHYGINSVNKLVVFCFPYGLRQSRDSSHITWVLAHIKGSLTLKTSKLCCPPAAISVVRPHCKAPEMGCPSPVQMQGTFQTR